jgi:CHAT domain/AAA ATPase domain
MFKEYLDFEFQISPLADDRYVISVSGPGGDASGVLTLPVSEPIYHDYIARLLSFDTDEEMLVGLGTRLFEALFSAKVKDVYTRSQGMLGPDQGLRLRLNIAPSEVAVAMVPWEFLIDPDQGPLAMLDAPIVRYLPQQAKTPHLAAALPLRVLLTGAQIHPQPSIERELNEIRSALADLGHLAQIVVEEHLSAAKLQRLLRQDFHIWHFVGHGAFSRDGQTGLLQFEDPSGDVELVSALQLSIMLNRTSLQLAVLDTCNSARLTTDPFRNIAPALIRGQIPAVIAMQFSVPEESTRAFVSEFYRALAAGFPIDACVTEGRRAVMNAVGLGRADWGIPVVYTRAPDGKLFDLPARHDLSGSTPVPRDNRQQRRSSVSEAQVSATETQHESGVLARPPAVMNTPVQTGDSAEQAPFIAGPPLAHPRQFFGREREIRRLFNLLRNSPLQNAAIIGPRRSGKTSLLHYLRGICTTPVGALRPEQRVDWLENPGAYLWIFVDFQDIRFAHQEQLLRYLLAALGMDLPNPCTIERFLDFVAGHLHRPVIILLDEIGVALQRYPELDDGFWEGLRALATNQSDGNLAFILAAHESPFELAHSNGHSSPFFNIFGYTTSLGPLTQAEALALIGTAPIPFPEADVEWILSESGRWPILVQILCRERLASLEEGDAGIAWREEGLQQMLPFRHLLEQR